MHLRESSMPTQQEWEVLFDVERIPFPCQGREQATLDAITAACRNVGVAALIVEPLILGAGGMLIYPAWVLAEMKRICAAHGVLLIADEVMTGWGRTGTCFACEQADVTPDIACYSKGLTGGTLPLAVTLCRTDIFDAHYSTDRSKTSSSASPPTSPTSRTWRTCAGPSWSTGWRSTAGSSRT